MALRRSFALTAATTVATTVVLAGAAAGPAHAADFSAAARKAVAEALPGHTLRDSTQSTPVSPLAKSRTVRVATATFAGPGTVLTVARGVGALREAARAQLSPGSRIVATVQVRRPGAGTRDALVTSAADEWGPGLTSLLWTERRGVNYQIAARGPVRHQDLVRVAQALPKDGTTVSRDVRRLVASAKPPVPSDLDRPGSGDVSARGTGNRIVDGVDVATNDLSDEATLCNGCAYWSGNWAGMWQHLMYADGKLDYGAIDCQFGAQTASATASWQRSEGLAADGIAGPDTRGRADNYLNLFYETNVYYMGSVRQIRFGRIGGHYYLGGAKITYGYGGGTLAGC
ncbi:MAG TPA: peptidoglycan-binding domain-containing protein [Thermomonospora sp.]|nr:peptidoglycan-binding domain-containing protein [Thermomonospora sp.]